MLNFKLDEEISLRIATESSAKDLYKLAEGSREYLREWLGWVDYVKSEEDIVRFLRETIKTSATEHRGYPIAFTISYNGETAGILDFHTIRKGSKIAEIGYWLGEDFQKRGIMIRAVKALINYGFTELGLNKVEIKVASENEKSRAIPERLGFVEEGILRQAEWLYDHYVDHVVYGLLKKEWDEIQK